MNVGFYEDNGWAPHVLCVNSEKSGGNVAPELVRTVPSQIPVRRVNAISESFGRPFGVKDLGVRAYTHLRKAGDAWIRELKPDLVFVSTTAFLTMPLAASWRRRFGVPFVLDLQDPWSAAPSHTRVFQRGGVKHRLMRFIHAIAEAGTVPKASGLIAVSEAYIDALSLAYPAVAAMPCDTVPFGCSELDFIVASELGQPWRPFEGQGPLMLAAGRAGVDMSRALKTLFHMKKIAMTEQVDLLKDARLAFLGTGYQPSGNPERVAPLAAAKGVDCYVRERADRVSLIDSIASLQAADFLILLGSDDLAYQPSKLYQYLATNKPVLCIAPSEGRLARAMAELQSVVTLPSDFELSADVVRTIAVKLSNLQTSAGYLHLVSERERVTGDLTARSLAVRECNLFDRALRYADGGSRCAQLRSCYQ